MSQNLNDTNDKRKERDYNRSHKQIWRLRPETPATREDKARRSVQSPRVLQSEFRTSLGNSAKPSLKIKNNRKGWGCSSVAEHLSGVCEALSSIPNTTEKKVIIPKEASRKKTIPTSLREDVTEFSFVFIPCADIRWQRDSPGQTITYHPVHRIYCPRVIVCAECWAPGSTYL